MDDVLPRLVDPHNLEEQIGIVSYQVFPDLRITGSSVIGGQGGHHIPIKVGDLAVEVARPQPDADQWAVQVILP